MLSNLSDEGMNIDLSIYKISLPPQINRQKIQAKKNTATGKPIYRYHNTKFSLNKKQIIDLLMGTKLYGKPEVALRELLQNSIDACLLRQKLSESWNIDYTPNIKVSLSENNGIDYLQVSDNGIGMNQHIIDNYYTNIGCSYYSSREFSELITSLKTSFLPISRFGIGILSCFMVCDSLEVITKRIKERYESDDALRVSIEGYESLFVISDANKKEPGTDTILTLRKAHPWERMNKDEFLKCIRTIVPNPAVQIDIKTEKGYEIHSSDHFNNLDLELLLDYTWQADENINKIEIDLTLDEYSFRGKGCIGIIVRNDVPVDGIEICSTDIDINGETYTLSSNMEYGVNCISEKSKMLSVNVDGDITTDDSIWKKCNSKSSLSIHGIEVPSNLFPDHYYRGQSETVIKLPFPFSFRLDIGQSSDLNLNSARTQIIYDDKWLLFEENLYRTICKKLVDTLNISDWNKLKKIIQKRNETTFNKIVQQF